MRRKAVLLLALLALPTFALAQSLGDLAAQEKARREKAKETGKKRPTKTFTDADLEAMATGDKTSTPAPPPEPVVESGPITSSEGQGHESDGGPKAEWRQRATQARGAVDAARQSVSSSSQDVERIGQDLNPMSLTYNNEDVNRILRLQSELTAAQAQLERANQELAAAEKAYKDFEDEARRQGVPPSWLQ